MISGNDEQSSTPGQELGAFLRRLRLQQSKTQEAVARDASIGVRTLARWEAGQALPRLPELQALLSCLNATPQERRQVLALLQVPRGYRALRQEGQASAATAMPLPDTLPGGNGALLRALRLRHHLPLEQVASQLHIVPSTLSRWERGEVTPTDETLQRLLTLLGAHPQEREALRGQGGWLHEPSVYGDTKVAIAELREQWEQFHDVVYANAQDALLDLRFFSLEARLRPVAQHSEGRELLAEVLAHHANHLLVFYRFKEARHYAERALTLMESARGRLQETIALRAGIAVAEAIAANGAIAHYGSHSAVQRALTLLCQYMPYANSREFLAWGRANEAKYLSRVGHPETAIAQASEACRIALYSDEPIELLMRQRDLAQLYLHGGRPEDALPLIHDWDTASPVERATAALLRAKALHTLGDPSAAEHLSRAVADITTHQLIHLQPQADLLAERLE